MMSTATIDGEWVLVVDDDEECLRLVAALLTRVGFEVRVARSGTRALEAVRLGRPLAVILEVRLPGVSGYELCHELRDRFGAELPIVFLSGTRVEPHDRTVGILAGADDYVVKPFDPNELLARLRRLAARARRAPRPTTGYDLTARERTVLGLLAAGKGQDAIASELFLSPKTVATHIHRTLTKLGVHSRAEAVSLAYRERLVPLEAPVADTADI